MEKSYTKYYATKIFEEDGKYSHCYDIDIKVDEKQNLIRCKYDRSWQSKEQAIQYLQWCIKEIKALDI